MRFPPDFASAQTRSCFVLVDDPTKAPLVQLANKSAADNFGRHRLISIVLGAFPIAKGRQIARSPLFSGKCLARTSERQTLYYLGWRKRSQHKAEAKKNA